MSIVRKNYDHLTKPVGPYVHAVMHDGLIFLSGLSAYGTPAQRGTLLEQATTVFERIESILTAEGIGFENLIKVSLFLTDLTELDKLRDFLFDFFKENLPASTLVQVKSLFSPDLKIGVEAIVSRLPK